MNSFDTATFKTFNASLMIALFLVFCLSTTSFAQGNIPTLHEPFPDITLPVLDGGEISLSDFEGDKNVVLVTYRGWVGYW